MSTLKWEYASIGLLTTDANQEKHWLCEMGSQGWELVATQRFERQKPDLSEQRFYFKRPLTAGVIGETKGKPPEQHGGDDDCG